jgi:integrase
MQAFREIVMNEQSDQEAKVSSVFTRYRCEKRQSTLEDQLLDLETFATFSISSGLVPQQLSSRSDLLAQQLDTQASAWIWIDAEIIQAFQAWQAKEGFAPGTINRRLSTLKARIRAVAEDQLIDASIAEAIRKIRGIPKAKIPDFNQKRNVSRLTTQKMESINISDAVVDELFAQQDTPIGRRDRVMIGFMLFQGIIGGVLINLRTRDVDLELGKINLFNTTPSKIVKLHPQLCDTLERYILLDTPPGDILLMGSHRSGKLTGRMSERAIQNRVRILGEAVGLKQLSPSDLRHYWLRKQSNNSA